MAPATPEPQEHIPHHTDAEKGLIGSIMLDAERIIPWCQAEGLTPEAFYFRSHSVFVEELYAMHSAGKLIDPITVTERLKEIGLYDSLGGSGLISGFIDSTPTSAHAEHYARLVHGAYLRRQAMSIATDIRQRAMDPDSDAAGAAHLGIEKLSGLLRVKTTERSAIDILNEQVESWKQVHHGIKRMVGMSTGYAGIDRFLGGLQPRKLYILGGRPSAGKTTLSLDIGMDLDDAITATATAAGDAIGDALSKKIPVGFVAMDMPRDDLLIRALCRRAGVSLSKLNFGFANDNDFDKIAAALPSVAGLPFFFTHSRQLQEIRSVARMWKNQGMRLLVIDYMQQIHDDTRKFFGDTERVTYVSSQIKQLTWELDLPILSLAQLNRAVSRESRAPRMDDFRDAGGIEQDASCAIILWNPVCEQFPVSLKGYWREDGVWMPDDRRTSYNIRPIKAEIVKQQNGPTGSVPLLLDGSYFNMRDVPRLRHVPNYFGHGTDADGRPDGSINDRHDADRSEADLWWHCYNQRKAEED